VFTNVYATFIPTGCRRNKKGFFFCSLAITHQYGREGRDTKKFDTKALLFDFEFLESLAQPQFIEQFRDKLVQFIDMLNTTDSKGNPPT
jgi:hypothetical protein